MTEKARRQDGEEAREEREGLPAELARELAPERDTQRDLAGATTSETDDVPAPDAAIAGATESTASTETTERPRARRASRKASAAQSRTTEDASKNATEDTAACATNETTGVTAISAIDADRIELEAQGFSADEADRLIDVSKRLESSAEALASQAELKRLRFAQWLIERGILDEFSV